MSTELDWLPSQADWEANLQSVRHLTDGPSVWQRLQDLARARLDFVQMGRLDREAQRLHSAEALQPEALRVALLGSSTVKHLIPAIRVAGMRHGLWLQMFEGGYGQYRQELLGPSPKLDQFSPQFVCIAVDAYSAAELMSEGVSNALSQVQHCWEQAKTRLGASVVQQTVLPVFGDLFGNNEHRLTISPQSLTAELNARLRGAADRAGVALLAIDKYIGLGGIDRWHDVALWHMAKQEVHPAVSPLYGELLVRIIAAQQGRSAKCLVLDLDNTIWGGTIGDDGMGGIMLTKGHAVGEAYLALQSYALQLKRRGVILAVCSKNDDATARHPFESHEGMILHPDDIACFLANWDDKATNLRRIANRLRIGLDSMVFVDDNPAERQLIRRELPEVRVPELPEDPAGYVSCLSRAGYFEALTLTEEDRCRAKVYRENSEREMSRVQASDLDGYLRELRMRACWRPFDEAGLARIVQLTNKTNQFNLTSERTSEQGVASMLEDPFVLSWQVRLKDRFGDNGVVALMHGRLVGGGIFELRNWLMSCRVLGRQMEEACMNVIADGARARGAHQIVGFYRPTPKNAMVRDLLGRLGFQAVGEEGDSVVRWRLDLLAFELRKTAVAIERG